MKSILNSTLVFLMLIHFNIAYCQQSCITAGDITVDNYTYFYPLDTILNFGYLIPPSIVNLDINNDNSTDFIITCFSGMNGWYVEECSIIQGVGNNKVLVNRAHPGYPDTLNFNSPICDSGLWASRATFCHSMYYPPPNLNTGYDSISGFENPNKYVGLKLVNSVNSTTYGWAQIVNPQPSEIIISAFGCGSFPPENGVITFPNPTDEYINIYLPHYNNYEVQLYDIKAEIIYNNIGNIKQIDIRLLASGIYFLRIITNDHTINQKIIVKRKTNN